MCGIHPTCTPYSPGAHPGLPVIRGLLADELVWQLRALERALRRRWTTRPTEPLPPPLAQWIAQVGAVCADLADSA